MAYVLIALLLSGLVLIAIGYIWLFLEAFKLNPVWGLGCLLIPGVSIVFAVYKPDRAMKPLVLLMVGVLLAAGPIWLRWI